MSDSLVVCPTESRYEWKPHSACTKSSATKVKSTSSSGTGLRPSDLPKASALDRLGSALSNLGRKGGGGRAMRQWGASVAIVNTKKQRDVAFVEC